MTPHGTFLPGFPPNEAKPHISYLVDQHFHFPPSLIPPVHPNWCAHLVQIEVHLSSLHFASEPFHPAKFPPPPRHTFRGITVKQHTETQSRKKSIDDEMGGRNRIDSALTSSPPSPCVREGQHSAYRATWNETCTAECCV